MNARHRRLVVDFPQLAQTRRLLGGNIPLWIRQQLIKEPILDLNTLSTIVALLVSFSIAAERLVEIVTAPFPLLTQERTDPHQERLRKAALQLLAVIAGVVTALLTRPVMQETLPGVELTLTGTLALVLWSAAVRASGTRFRGISMPSRTSGNSLRLN
jgi:hypothetical protein